MKNTRPFAHPFSHPFDQAVALSEQDGRLVGRTSTAYANMIGPFGGATAATLLKGALDHADRLGEPLSLTINFAAPIQDGPFDVDVRPLRTNRSTQHWLLTLSQGDAPAAIATAIFAKRRETWAATDLVFPAVPPFERCEPLDNSDFPPWVRSYDLRFIGESPSFFTHTALGDAPTSETMQWVRDEPPRPLDFLSLIAYCDIFFPRLFIRRRQFSPVGTVTMTAFFHVSEAFLTAHGDREILAVARANRFGQGYFDQSAELWTPTGDLLATTTQMVYFKDAA